jgi:cytochrome c2
MKPEQPKHKWVMVLAALVFASLATASWFFFLHKGNQNSQRSYDTAVALTQGGDPQAGAKVIETVGCGACHEIPGIHAAAGQIGPSLKGFKNRAMIAGVLSNSADNLQNWIIDPRSIDPKTAMPNLGITPQQARDISAYLLLH